MNQQPLDHIRAIAFDADDTLWACQPHFDDVERRYCALLSAYGTREEVSAALFSTETANMALLGYGCKAFVISLVENAVRVSGGKVTGDTVGQIISLGKELLSLPATPLDGVRETLERLRQGPCRLAVYTKGELLDQENKLRRSGLLPFFDVVSIVSNKTPESFLRLSEMLGVPEEDVSMVGDSFRSDCAPALEAGGSAIHVPSASQWQHEVSEPFDHPRLRTVERFSLITTVIENAL